MKKINQTLVILLVTIPNFIFGENEIRTNFLETNTEFDFQVIQKSEGNLICMVTVSDEAESQVIEETQESEVVKFNSTVSEELKPIEISNQRPVAEGANILQTKKSKTDASAFQFENWNLKNGKIEIFDEQGSSTFQQYIYGNEFQLFRNELIAGNYYYSITDEGKAINAGNIEVS